MNIEKLNQKVAPNLEENLVVLLKNTLKPRGPFKALDD